MQRAKEDDRDGQELSPRYGPLDVEGDAADAAPTDAVTELSAADAVGVSLLVGGSVAGLVLNYNMPGCVAAGLRDEHNLTHADLSLLFVSYAVPSAPSTAFAAAAVERAGLTAVSFGCSVLILAGAVLFSVSTGIRTMAAARALLGAGDALGLACAPAMVSAWFRGSAHHGLAMGTALMTTQLLGAAVPFAALPELREWLGLKAALRVGPISQALSITCLIGFTALTWRRKGVAVGSPPPSSAPSFAERCRSLPRQYWVQVAVVCCVPSTQYLSLGLMPDYLQEARRMGEQEAGSWTSAAYWCCTTAPLWGRLLDAGVLSRAQLQAFFSATALLYFVALSTDMAAPPLVVTLGVLFAAMEQNCYVMIEAQLPPDLSPFAFSVMGFCYNVALAAYAALVAALPLAWTPFCCAGALAAAAVLTVVTEGLSCPARMAPLAAVAVPYAPLLASVAHRVLKS
eukprot:TRINITY_DN48383_c0_g1_i1.p1 TRINITY_DN48383_c0_g1~~TRINITY_DN48383_c0_g1_i1.p1  ORF type:complete len:468 (+),score=127.57 TRINITY_DN48383_c0_g1_i1:35-1405(+)